MRKPPRKRIGESRRFEDWPERLNAAIMAAGELTFQWGKNDCCLFASNCIKAMTGDDPAKGIRGRYRSEEKALAILKEEGGVEAIVRGKAREFGWKKIPPIEAQRGDVATCKWPEGIAVGVCNGVEVLFVTREGLRGVKKSECRRAWRVG